VWIFARKPRRTLHRRFSVANANQPMIESDPPQPHTLFNEALIRGYRFECSIRNRDSGIRCTSGAEATGEWSAASARVKPATAALGGVVLQLRRCDDGTYGGDVNDGTPLLRRISGTAALAQKTSLIRLTLRISFQLAALASSTFSYLRMTAFVDEVIECPNFCAAPLTKARHAVWVQRQPA